MNSISKTKEKNLKAAKSSFLASIWALLSLKSCHEASKSGGKKLTREILAAPQLLTMEDMEQDLIVKKS